MPLLDIVDQATHFLHLLESDLQKNNIYLDSNWRPDHICYRTSSVENYAARKDDFSRLGELLGETLVNGRNIATYRLHNPLPWKHHKIWLVEVPAPKKAGTKEGFEHMEIICDCPFETLRLMNPLAKWDGSGLNKPFNQELEIVMGERNIKFHHQSLSSVMRLERNQKVWDALISSEILTSLSQWHPFVAGTFPLGVEAEDSDLDILLTLKNTEALKEKLQPLLNRSTEVSWKENTEKLISLSFTYLGIKFDLYAEPTLSYHQMAARHFRVEEKILEDGNAQLREKIISLRKAGLKTEPAFAQALGLKGDPYEALLNYEST